MKNIYTTQSRIQVYLEQSAAEEFLFVIPYPPSQMLL